MKRIIVALALCLAFALPAQAEVTGVYAGLKVIDSIQNTGNISVDGVGDNILDQYGQNTFGGGIFVGYDFYPQMQMPIRAELEYAIRSSMNDSWGETFGGDKVEVENTRNTQTLFANFYWDFHNDTAFTPYVGAGLGMAFTNSKWTIEENGTEVSSKTYNTTSFAWNAGLGVSYAINDMMAVDLAYRFVSFGNVENDELSSNPYANEFSLGMRMTF